MTDSTSNRAGRRATANRAKTAAVAGTAAAAMAVGLAGAPAAQAIDVNVTWYPTYTSGALADILNLVGNLIPGQDLQLNENFSFSSGPPQSVGLSITAEVAGISANVIAALNLKNIPGNAKNLYNTVAGTPQQGGCTSSDKQSTCRYILQLATSQAVMNLVDAYRNEISSVKGNTPAGLIPFGAGPNATATQPAQTNQAFILLQNALRPNGGIAARFPDISKALGINPDMPAAGKITSPDKKIALNTTTLDLTWAYDPIGDFPAVFNPTAILNSAMAGLPLNIIDGLAAEPIQGDSLKDIGLNLGAVLQFPGVPVLGTLGLEDGKAFYSTLVPNLMPILVPSALPGTIINFGLKALGSPFLLGNPFVNVLNPVMKILVNTGYTDVLSPTKLNTCAQDCYTANPKSWAALGYSAYDRTFGFNPATNPATPNTVASASTPTPFGSVQPLTPEEQRAVPGDAWNAFTGAFKAEIAKPYFGILVPNTPAAPAAAKPAAVPAAAATTVAPQAVSAPAAPAVADSAPAPVQAEPVAPAPAPESVPVPAELAAAARDSGPSEDPAPVVATHRGGSSSSGNSGNSDSPKAAASTGHRGA